MDTQKKMNEAYEDLKVCIQYVYELMHIEHFNTGDEKQEDFYNEITASLFNIFSNDEIFLSNIHDITDKGISGYFGVFQEFNITVLGSWIREYIKEEEEKQRIENMGVNELNILINKEINAL